MANIQWTVGVGSDASTLTLGSLRTSPANRFFDATPDYDPVGDTEVAMDGQIHTFLFREDFLLNLVLQHLRSGQQLLMVELKQHLMNGGEVTVNTEDATNQVFTGVKLAPGTKPEIKKSDELRNLYTFTVSLMKNSAMTVDYDV
jgi:hypothetical protein